jgi:hypothetical protein
MSMRPIQTYINTSAGDDVTMTTIAGSDIIAVACMEADSGRPATFAMTATEARLFAFEVQRMAGISEPLALAGGV